MFDQLTAFFAPLGSPVFVVGGCVRDQLLSRPYNRDIDLAVAGDVAPIADGLARRLGGTVVPLSPSRGMARVVVGPGAVACGGPATRPWTIDLCGYAGTIEEELGRRDFSINAMGVALASWRDLTDPAALIDPYGGRQDLVRKQLRALAPDVFESDPGRLMRAMRLSSQLGFRLETDTVRLLASESHRLTQVSPDRVRDEFLGIMSLNGAKGQLEAMDRLGLLRHVVPELQQTKDVDQPRMHYWDVWGHTLHTVETAELVTQGHQNSPIYSCVPWTPESEVYFGQTVADGHTRRTVLKVGALFHDIAKPQTKTVDETGRTRFFGHSELGAEVAANRLRELRVSSKGVAMVSKMVEQHLRPTNMMQEGGEWPTNRAIYRYFRDVGDVAIDTLYLCLADYLGAKGPELSHPEWLNHARMVGHILHVGTNEPVSPATNRLITGRDLMAHLELEPGPRIGSLLEIVEEARAAGEIETPEQALDLAAKTLQSPGDSH